MFGKAKAEQTAAAADAKSYHCMDLDQIQRELNVNVDTGLAPSEAENRLSIYGQNEMRGGGRPSAFKILLRQLANLMTVILIAAVAIAFAIQDWVEA
ncbi:P-type ATPase, partial [Coemansia sp. RSA 2611]